ncbi:uncharacterized protein LOC111319341 [Stylophora pistillata]|uniref:uncharacterized protein LOC111319341 n=1 Tax=Stylophora pistillata TaxID=50429 RepID=UPI000C04DD84|nr:uncharacterized protein LOC111319341 [Stylophora pistillata]
MICRNETDTSIDRGCCESWCEQLASCFRQSSNWTSRCTQMWRCRNPRKKLSINTTDSLYLGSIQVKHCWARNFTAIKLTTVIEFPSKKLVDTILKEVINSFGYEANQEKIERALLSVTDLEEFIGKYSQYHLNETATKIYIRCEHAGE